MYRVDLTPLTSRRFLDDAELARHLPLQSIDFDITIGSTCVGRDRTAVEKMSIYSLQRLLSCCSWSSGEPSNVIMTMISSGDSRFALSGRTSMSSSSAMASSNWLLSMRVDSSIGMGVVDVILAGQEGDQASSSSTSKEYCHILASQMGCMWCKAVRRRYSISLMMVSLASPIGSGRRLIEVMRKFVHEMVLSDDSCR